MKIIRDFSLTLNVDDILKGEGINFASSRPKRPALIKAAENALELGMSNIHPVAVSTLLKVIHHKPGEIHLENGNILTGSLVDHFLPEAVRIIAVACTIGPELENLVSIKMYKDPLLALAIDGLGNAAVESIAQQMCENISREERSKGLETSSPISPGDPDWPLKIGQSEIFSLLDTYQIGIQLTKDSLMIPVKSISFILGIGPIMKQEKLCPRCSMWGRCRYKHE